MLFDGVKAPRLIVEVAFALSPSTDPAVTPYLVLDGSVTPLNTGTLGAVAMWTDVSSDVQAVSVWRGRTDELADIEPGTCDVLLDNTGGTYDPLNSNSPFWIPGVGSSVIPNRQIRVRAVWQGITYPVYQGYIDEFDFNMGGSPTVSLNCVDGLSLLAATGLSEIEPAYYGDLTSSRVSRVLDFIGWPSTLRSIQTGQTVMCNTQYGGNALEELDKAAQAEFGLVFADASGKVVFYNRGYMYSSSRSRTSQLSFTDSLAVPATSDAEYDSLKLTYGVSTVFNDISVHRWFASNDPDTNPTLSVQDSASIARYGRRTLQGPDSLMVTTDTEAGNYAALLLARYKTPLLRVTEVSSNMLPQPSAMANALGLTLFDRIGVQRSYGSSSMSGELIIQGIGMEINADEWTYTLATSPAIAQPFILDTSTLAADSDTLPTGWNNTNARGIGVLGY